jgi:hypothetical protein
MTKKEIFAELETLDQQQRAIEKRRREIFAQVRETLATYKPGQVISAGSGSSRADRFLKIERVTVDHTSEAANRERSGAWSKANPGAIIPARINITYVGKVLKKDGTPHKTHTEHAWQFIRNEETQPEKEPS